MLVITQTTEPQASTNLVQAIFTSTNDQTLIEILSDANNGNQVIGKIIAVNTIAEDQKKQMVEAVRRVLPNIKASTTPPYRMLLEAVGLPVPAGYVSGSPFGRNPTPQWQPNRPQQFSQAYYPYHQPVNGASYQAVNGLGNLSPLLIPQTMPLGQMRGNPQPGKSPRTPAARQGRLSSPGSMMSPASDPFNPVSQFVLESHLSRSGVCMANILTFMSYSSLPRALMCNTLVRGVCAWARRLVNPQLLSSNNPPLADWEWAGKDRVVG